MFIYWKSGNIFFKIRDINKNQESAAEIKEFSLTAKPNLCF